MTDSFVTAALEGSIPAPMEQYAAIQEQGCDEVTLTITLLVRNGDYVVARFNLDSPYWLDEHEYANGTWSLALPRFEMLHLIATLLRSRFMKVILKGEQLLA